jgi:hypothetical protein
MALVFSIKLSTVIFVFFQLKLSKFQTSCSWPVCGLLVWVHKDEGFCAHRIQPLFLGERTRWDSNFKQHNSNNNSIPAIITQMTR